MMFIALAWSALLTACGDAASSGDPLSTVQAAMSAVTSKQFDKLDKLACTIKKDAVTGQLNPAAALINQGLSKEDAQKLLAALTISFDNAEYGTPAIHGDAATVSLKGKLSATFDKDKLKASIKAIIAAQGMVGATDEQINQAVDLAAAQLPPVQQVNLTLDLIKENGKWIICPK